MSRMASFTGTAMSTVLRYYRGEMTVRLSLLFVAMDLLTLIVHPIVFVYGKLRQFSKSAEDIALANFLVISPVARQRGDRRMTSMRKES